MTVLLMSGGLAGLAGYDASHGATPVEAGMPPGQPTRQPVPPASLLPIFRTAAARHGVALSLLLAIAAQESGFQPNARSSAGADGIMQMLPRTFQAYAPLGTTSEAIWDPGTEIDAAAALLAANGAATGASRQAVFDYNHDDGYVRQVLGRQADYEAWLQAGTPPAAGSGAPLRWPLRGPVTQPFGCTGVGIEPPLGGCAHFHTGLDIAAKAGTDVLAACPGKVATAVDATTGFGIHVVVVCDTGGISTLYGHLAARLVSPGDRVDLGQGIGYEGSTGNSTGPHLHFEVDEAGRPRDPLGYLRG